MREMKDTIAKNINTFIKDDSVVSRATLELRMKLTMNRS